MEYIEMKKEIDRLNTQLISLNVSLHRRTQEVEKYKTAFNGAEFCNKTLQEEIERLKEENEDLQSKLELLFKERENGTNQKNTNIRHIKLYENS